MDPLFEKMMQESSRLADYYGRYEYGVAGGGLLITGILFLLLSLIGDTLVQISLNGQRDELNPNEHKHLSYVSAAVSILSYGLILSGLVMIMKAL